MPKGRESGMPDAAYWESYFNPACIVSKLDCRGGDVVEFGCGYGLFTVPASRSVSGNVYALDIDPAMVEATIHDSRWRELAHQSAECREK
jgi:ribosomal protein L11 methylase PrmA